jgi:hypothetical protein
VKRVGTLGVTALAVARVEGCIDVGRRALRSPDRQEQEHREVLRERDRLEGRSVAGAELRPVAEEERDIGAERCRFARRSAAAASLLPPPRPAATGMRFSIRTRHSPPSSASARRTIVSSKPVTVVSSAGSTSISSARSSAW